ncbi:M-phase inducer phosphatase-like [Mizuhopecten yessoensis]|uniref:M-phase inducer phosphatase-like n=1 Tax=Mizuhopecten yessoensis TaxID=6573 RepID=UPI000B45B4AE|nr:M-phase inducer phosphatase-like [Mizuhopecten yessoensis]
MQYLSRGPGTAWMTSSLTFTPCRNLDFDDDEVKSLMIPEVKKNLCQLFDDEDSGLGMDDDVFGSPTDYKLSTRLDFSSVFDSPVQEKVANEKLANGRDTSFRRSLLSGKRPRDDDEDSCSPPPKSQRRGDGVSRRALSFGDNLMLESRDVKTAVNRLVEEEDLVGDGTDTFCLPTIRGKHQDLKSISTHTMADILTGRYDDVINDYRIIDCRYPYEFEGGHIQNAENRYTRDQVQQLLQERRIDVTGKRNILIFHCEFSSERGPKMMRFLRTHDRAQNEANYPALTFPEVYLLDGGFKAFYHNDRTLCQPMEYMPMLHPGHCEDLRHFRSKSKSWSAGDKKKTVCGRHV